MRNSVIALLGCGGHARSVADVVLHNDSKSEIIFVDSNAQDNEHIMGFPVIKKLEDNQILSCPAVGDNKLREEISQGKNLISVISSDASIGVEAIIGDGSFIGHKAHIGPQTIIGKCCIVNTASIVEHNVKIGSFCHLAPNCTLCGGVNLGNNVFVGAGAVIRNNIHICSDVVIGAGAVVVADILEAGTYIGCPAKLEKK